MASFYEPEGPSGRPSSVCISLLRGVTPCVIADTHLLGACHLLQGAVQTRIPGKHWYIFTKLHGKVSRNCDIIHSYHHLIFPSSISSTPLFGVCLSQPGRSQPSFQRRFFPIIHIHQLQFVTLVVRPYCSWFYLGDAMVVIAIRIRLYLLECS